MEERILQLEAKVAELESTSRSFTMEETIRNIVIFDQDAVTATTAVGTTSGGQTITIPVAPTQWGIVRFRGRLFRIALYAIT